MVLTAKSVAEAQAKPSTSKAAASTSWATPRAMIPRSPTAVSSLNAANGLSTISAFVTVANARRAPQDKWNKLFHLDCQIVVAAPSGEFKVLLGLGSSFNGAGLDFPTLFAIPRPFPVFELEGTFAKYFPAIGMHGAGYHFVSEISTLKHIGYLDPEYIEGSGQEEQGEVDEEESDEAEAEHPEGGEADGQEVDDDGGNGADEDLPEEDQSGSPQFAGLNMMTVAELASSVTMVSVGMVHSSNTTTNSFLMDVQLYIPDGIHHKSTDALSTPSPLSSSVDSGVNLGAFKPIAPVCCAWPPDKNFKKPPPVPRNGRFVACFGTLFDFSLEPGDVVELSHAQIRIFQLASLGVSQDRNVWLLLLELVLTFPGSEEGHQDLRTRLPAPKKARTTAAEKASVKKLENSGQTAEKGKKKASGDGQVGAGNHIPLPPNELITAEIVYIVNE
ncbi:hypothetical protein BKA70DRAFT_1242993 [Coprinopsis sp. MPI-PUGE-AT-0042]|nr:hypothetical protein BKA70DRAFT_1242993 [Coprinopsis sp. MPI-PUGE-AT-0042]